MNILVVEDEALITDFLRRGLEDESPACRGSALISLELLSRDRFFGATRQLEVAAGSGRLEIETALRDHVQSVRVPREAIQFLNAR